MRSVRQAEKVGKSLWRDINLEAWEKIFTHPKWNGQWTLRYGFVSYTFITGWTTTNVMHYIEFRVPVNWMIEAMCLPFFKVWVNEMCNFKIWFHSTSGVAPEGDVFLSVTFPENSSLIQNFTATLTDAAADEERAKKMYLDTLAPGTVSPPVYLCQHKDYAKS